MVDLEVGGAGNDAFRVVRRLDADVHLDGDAAAASEIRII